MNQDWYIPLMDNNIDRTDCNAVIEFLSQPEIPRLSNGPKVLEFEEKWSKWLGVKYSVAVNSGTMANQLTMLNLRRMFPQGGSVVVPLITWISDWASVVQNGFEPITCDINLKTLSFDFEQLKKIIKPDTRAIFLTHVLGLNALSDELLQFCKDKNIILIEDVCESTGATFKGQKLGTFGHVSNFSGYVAHHFSCVEFGVISTNDYETYQYLRAYRAHGLVREFSDNKLKQKYIDENPQLNKEFIFVGHAYNGRTTEINAVIGLSQLLKLDSNNKKRIENFQYFIDNLDGNKFYKDFQMEGQCDYAFLLILKNYSISNRDLLEKTLNDNRIEWRRGLSGGGSQLRHRFNGKITGLDYKDYPTAEYVSDVGYYVGNFPSLERTKIDRLLYILNSLPI